MSDDSKPAIPENAPWWSKAIEAVIHTGGISLLLVLFWMGQQAGWIPNPVADKLMEVVEGQEKILVAQGEVLKGMQQDAGHAIRHDATMQEMVKHIDLAMKRSQKKCILDAKTDDEKKACFPD